MRYITILTAFVLGLALGTWGSTLYVRSLVNDRVNDMELTVIEVPVPQRYVDIICLGLVEFTRDDHKTALRYWEEDPASPLVGFFLGLGVEHGQAAYNCFQAVK